MQAGVEAFLLLIGVVLALMGQAWWEDREERETVREYAVNLRVEVSANQEELRKAIQKHASYIKDGTELIQEMQHPLDPESILSMKERVVKFGYVSDFRPSTSSLENLVGSGGLRQLDNTELQLAISNYAGSIEDHNVLQAENLKLFFDAYVPFISDRASLLDFEFVSDSSGLPKRSRFDFDIEVLTGSKVFENLIVRRISAEVDAKKYAMRLLQAAEQLKRLLPDNAA